MASVSALEAKALSHAMPDRDKKKGGLTRLVLAAPELETIGLWDGVKVNPKP